MWINGNASFNATTFGQRYPVLSKVFLAAVIIAVLMYVFASIRFYKSLYEKGVPLFYSIGVIVYCIGIILICMNHFQPSINVIIPLGINCLI